MTKQCPDCHRPMRRNATGWWCACGKRIMDLPRGYKKQKKVKK